MNQKLYNLHLLGADSDTDVNDASNITCDDIDIYLPDRGPYITVDWTWFSCLKTRKCIHINSRCDLHPHPDCIYEKDGLLVAEDEEDCFEEYKKKGMVPKSANLICQSPSHNSMSPAILSTVFNFTTNEYMFNVSIISKGTMVNTMGTRCDGKFDCWNNVDEYKCGYTTFEYFLIGKYNSTSTLV